MGHLGFEVRWKIDDVDGTKRTFLRANTATDTETFRDICDFGLGSDFDAQFAGADDRAGLFAFLPTFLRNVSNNGSPFEGDFSPTFGLHCWAKIYIVSGGVINMQVVVRPTNLVTVDDGNSGGDISKRTAV